MEPLKELASASGNLLTCDTSAPEYVVSGKLDRVSAETLMPVVNAIDEELKARGLLIATRREQVWTFEGLLYSYSNSLGTEDKASSHKKSTVTIGDTKVVTVKSDAGGREWSGPALDSSQSKGREKSDVHLPDLVRRAAGGDSQDMGGVWSRPLRLLRSSPFVTRKEKRSKTETDSETESESKSESKSETKPESESKPETKSEKQTAMTPVTLALMFLKNQLEMLFAVRSMAESFNFTDEMASAQPSFSSHSNIWAAMKHSQMPAEES